MRAALARSKNSNGSIQILVNLFSASPSSRNITLWGAEPVSHPSFPLPKPAELTLGLRNSPLRITTSSHGSSSGSFQKVSPSPFVRSPIPPAGRGCFCSARLLRKGAGEKPDGRGGTFRFRRGIFVQWSKFCVGTVKIWQVDLSFWKQYGLERREIGLVFKAAVSFFSGCR